MAILNRVMHTAPLADIIDHSTSDKRLGQWLPTANLTELRAYVRSHLETLFHPTSTARMAPLSDGGVVDPRLRVYGVQGLRIVDASVFPTITSGHTVSWLLTVSSSYPHGCCSELAHGIAFMLPRPWLTAAWSPCPCRVDLLLALCRCHVCRKSPMDD